MAGVTTIQENIIIKHYTEEERVYVENNAEPSLKTISGQKCRSKPTASFQLEKRRLRFFWKSICGNTRWPQLHLGSIHHWEQLQKITEASVSSRFPTTWKKSKKKSNTVVKWQKNTRRREILHTIYISFWSGVSTSNLYSAMLSLGTALIAVGVVPPGGLAGVCALFSFFRLQPARKWWLKIIFIHPCVIKAWKRESVTRPVSKAFSDSNVTDDEFGNGSKPRIQGRIRRKLRKATKVVEQSHVEQRDLEKNGLKIWEEFQKEEKKKFRTTLF